MYKENVYITNGGNILRSNFYGKHYFMSPQKEFIRQVSDSEFNYLTSVCIKAEIEIEGEFNEMPTWYFIKSILVVQDNSNYRWETCNNGGNYSFQVYHDWYATWYPNGEWKFAFVERHSTSAAFSYDELAGRFQSNLESLTLLNTGDQSFYWTQSPSDIEEVLEKIATMSCFKDMWTEQYEYIPSRWNEEDEAEIVVGLSFSLKKEIITRLKELGVTKQDKKPSPRGQRRGGNRR